MQFENTLIEGLLIKRYKRFLADIELTDGRIVTAHCPNSGAMLGVKEPGLRVWLSEVPPSSTRTLRYTWEMVQVDGIYVGVNTGHPNKLVREALEAKIIEPLAHYTRFRPEVKYGENSRIDFLLEGEGMSPCYLEVKNVHLERGSIAAFPDSVTARGAKHMRELKNVVLDGAKACILYVVQREDCEKFTLASDIDPTYAAAAKEAYAAGVMPLSYKCEISPQCIKILQPIQII